MPPVELRGGPEAGMALLFLLAGITPAEDSGNQF